MKNLGFRRLGSWWFRLVLSGLLAHSFATVGFGGNFFSSGSPGTGGTTNGVWFTPNKTWTVAQRQISAVFLPGLNDVLEDYNFTDLTVVVTANAASCTPSDGFDECTFDSNYGANGLYGWNACAGLVQGVHPNQVCTQQWARVNTNYFPNSISIWCHELGHGVGLRHNDNPNSCVNDDTPQQQHLSIHDKAHIATRY